MAGVASNFPITDDTQYYVKPFIGQGSYFVWVFI